MTTPPTASVLIPSFRRPRQLEACLRGLAAQVRAPDEVIVVWQGDDAGTRDAAEAMRDAMPCALRILHSPDPGIVPAENLALETAVGEVVLLIDDDAIAPPDWVARHLAHYADPRVGAVGGPAVNHNPDGTPFPRRAVEPTGRLTWFGKSYGNMYDHEESWRRRPPREVDHLVGYNMSLRRAAFGRFEGRLRPYWQGFEMDACLQSGARGYRVLLDFANVVDHHPTNTAYVGSRDGDLGVTVDNASYNSAFILSKHSPAALRPWRLIYLLGVGTTVVPGLLALPRSVRRFGRPGRELGIMLRAWRHGLAGWRAGARARREARAIGSAGRLPVHTGPH